MRRGTICAAIFGRAICCETGKGRAIWGRTICCCCWPSAASAESTGAASRIAQAQRDHLKERDMNFPPLVGTQAERPTIQTGKEYGKAKRQRGQALRWRLIRLGGSPSIK